MKRITFIAIVLVALMMFAACGQQPAATSTAPAASAATAAPATVAPTASATTAATSAGTTTYKDGRTKPKVVFQNVGAGAPYVAGQIKAYNILAQKYNWDFVVLDGKLDSVQNAKDMETAISMNPDVIITMSIDVTATSASYKKAWDAGIPVLVDTIAVLPADKQYTVGYSGPNDYDHGVEVAEMMNEKLGGKGNIVVLTTPPGQSTTDLRMGGFTDTLKKLNSNINILGSNSNDNVKDKAITVMQDFITKFGDKINGVYAMEDYGAMGAQVALKEAGYDMSKITIIGVGGSAEGLKAVKDGILYATTLQSPTIACTQAAELVQTILSKGIKPPKQLDTYFNYIKIPKITTANVDQYLPGEW